MLDFGFLTHRLDMVNSITIRLVNPTFSSNVDNPAVSVTSDHDGNKLGI